MPDDASAAVKLFAGISEKNPSLYRRLRVPLGDPAAWVQLGGTAIALVRDLEMDRVRQNCDADRVVCPADYAPSGGLDADRETATAQAVAELLRQKEVDTIVSDRTLPLIYAWHLKDVGIDVQYDPEWVFWIDGKNPSRKLSS